MQDIFQSPSFLAVLVLPWRYSGSSARLAAGQGHLQLDKLWWHDGKCPARLLQAGGSFLVLGGPAPALWTDTSYGVQSTDVFAGYCLFALTFRGWFRFIFDQWSMGRSLKPRESEGRWGDTGSAPSLILLLSLLPVRVYAH